MAFCQELLYNRRYKSKIRKGIKKFRGIVLIGAVFVDIKGYPLSTYIPGGRNAGRIEQVHGGVSRNVVEDIANVELRPTFVGLVDDTGMGQDVIDKLARHKVNTRFIQKKPDGMGTWLAIFDKDGDVHAAISKRPDTTPLTGLLQEQGDEIFADCDSIALELDLEKETVKQVLRFAKKYNKRVYAAISNMSIAMERRDFLQQIDCFICNQQEAGLLFSDDYDHLSPDEMCRVLTGNVRSANIPSMVVTMGGQGAVYAKHTGECGVVPAKKVDVIDTTGAGDGFIGSFLWQLERDGVTRNKLEKLSRARLCEYLAFSNQFCGISVQQHGAIDSYPTLDQMQ